jgi:hypothetical protein
MGKRLGLRPTASLNRKHGLALGGLGTFAALVAVVALVGSGSALASNTGCPSLSGKLASTDISASFTDNGDGTATYTIDTPSDSPTDGVPGLIKYCVFTSPSPDTATADYTGWKSGIDPSAFAFMRPDGNPSNIPFDGSTGVDVGTAAWTSGTVPAVQVILLHINDAAECDALYGDTSGTCWVLPTGACVVTVGNDCGGGTASATDVETEIHLESNGADTDPPTVVGGSTHVDLGSKVHDKATVTADDGSTPQGTVDFIFYTTIDCSTPPDGTAAGSVSLDNTGVAHPSDSEGPLAAGDYGFQAFFTSDDLTQWTNGISPCEPLTVDQGTTTTATAIHRGATDAGAPVVVTSINAGQTVHDSATVTGTPAAFTPTGTVDFTWFPNGRCTEGTGTAAGTGVPLVAGVADPSTAETPLTPGSYAFQATYSGDDNYTGSTSDCEPLTVYSAPLTPGYWKTHLTLDSKHPTAPYTLKYLPICLGGTWNGTDCTGGYLYLSKHQYAVVTTANATAVFNAMNCSNTGSNSALNQNAIGCLAGHLLAAKLNVANGSDPCINTTIAAADLLLAGDHYVGPTGNYTGISNRSAAIVLKTALDKYNNGGGC